MAPDTPPPERPAPAAAKGLKRGQRLGKYRIERRIGSGGFADVYAARDTVEGINVALKVPHAKHARGRTLDDLLREVRLAARLEHPNILPVKNAEFVGERLVIAYRLGVETLGDRLQRRVSTRRALSWAEQLLEALAYAHANRVIHCDVKPDNLLFIGDDRVCLSDFGIARVAHRTLRDGSGSGTIGYLAPEQALGKPSFRSDVFSAGLLIYRMLAGELPDWPFEWPLPGLRRLERRVSPGVIEVLRRALHVHARRRYANAGAMLEAWQRHKPSAATPRRRRRGRRRAAAQPASDWKRVRQRQYLRSFRSELPHEDDCRACGGPLTAVMSACPWCGVERKRHQGKVDFPAACPRCGRGLKLDWTYCPWCWGPGFEVDNKRAYSDKRYAARCGSPSCGRRDLMPFMRYCPWCHTKVTRPWKLRHSKRTCGRCGWGVAGEHWSHCAWCAAPLND
jgi:serine/threonine-protein kinase